MQRAATSFALAAALLLALGLALQHFTAGRYAMSIRFPKGTHAIGYQIPCYALATIFAAFAFLYALNLPRLGSITAQWHFWLSLGSVALFAVGFADFAALAQQNPETPSQASLILPAVGMTLGPALFAAAQLFFVVATARAAFSASPAPLP
jgi:hypothetical protein